ncbi:MAG TPA: TonB-dependent vitamin B12 receptor, partial [Pseudomonas sp.]|nr:TonB-dependent vitamin B12 receptor [Pseudomonas sp.]
MRNSLPLAAVLLGLPSCVLADHGDALLLGQQVITASRTGHSPVSIASSSLITRDEIERQQAGSVPELLQRLAGVSVTSNGGRGKSTSVSIRGTSDKHVLVLIDGVRVGSATSGSAALQSIPVEQIERIEIVRGPRSSLYGSEAMGGVIQIFTRRGGAKGFKPYFSVGAGSRSSYSGSAGVAGSHGN